MFCRTYQLLEHAEDWRERVNIIIDLAEMALQQKVTTYIINIDTDELVDWVVGADEDSASVEDDDNELGNGLDPNEDI